MDVVVPAQWAVVIIVMALVIETGAIASVVGLVLKDVREFWKYLPMKLVTIPALVLLIPTVYVLTIITAVELFRSLGA